MPLETANYISQLVDTNPADTDSEGQGSDHLRLIKTCLLQNFPNFTAAALESTNSAIDTAVAAVGSGTSLVPTGAVMAFGGSSAPTGFLLCNGGSYSTTTYATLYGVIGYTYGGSGSSFNVPDLGGRVVAGNDTSSQRLDGSGIGGDGPGNAGGAATVTLTTGQLPSHNHGVTDPGHTHSVTDPGHTHSISDPGHTHSTTGSDDILALNTSVSGSISNPFTVSGSDEVVDLTSQSTGSATTGITVSSHTTGISNQTATTGITTQDTGSGSAVSVVQPTLIMNYIIKT